MTLASHAGPASAWRRCACPRPRRAQEAFAGVYAHEVDTPLSFETGEGGADLAVGVALRSDRGAGGRRPAGALRDRLAQHDRRHLVRRRGAELDPRQGTGLLAPGGRRIVVHDGPDYPLRSAPRTSRPSSAAGCCSSPNWRSAIASTSKLAVEASWMHVSHARLFNAQQNPGIDMWGARLNYRL